MKRKSTVCSEILLSVRRRGGVCFRICSTCSRTCTPVCRQRPVTRYETTATQNNDIWAIVQSGSCTLHSAVLNWVQHSPGLRGVPAVFEPCGEHTPGRAAHALLQGTSKILLRLHQSETHALTRVTQAHGSLEGGWNYTFVFPGQRGCPRQSVLPG